MERGHEEREMANKDTDKRFFRAEKKCLQTKEKNENCFDNKHICCFVHGAFVQLEETIYAQFILTVGSSSLRLPLSTSKDGRADN